MQDILDCLYEYVYEHRLGVYLNAEAEYETACRLADRAEAWLADHLSPEARGQLERLTESRAQREEALERALFRCGLGLGLELGALNRFPG